MRVLIVEDDPKAMAYMKRAFSELGNTADGVANGVDGFDRARDGNYDILIVDRMLPKMDGLTMVERLRAEKVDTPVLILSALSQVDQRVEGLRAGGDDYLTKPYAFSELSARVEALTRRRAPDAGETVLRVHDLRLDRLTRKVWRGEKNLLIQPREYRLLEFLMRHADQVVTRTMLLEGVWEYHFDPETNVIDVHIHRLRGKLDKGFERPLLHTVRGAGYKLSSHP